MQMNLKESGERGDTAPEVEETGISDPLETHYFPQPGTRILEPRLVNQNFILEIEMVFEQMT